MQISTICIFHIPYAVTTCCVHNLNASWHIESVTLQVFVLKQTLHIFTFCISHVHISHMSWRIHSQYVITRFNSLLWDFHFKLSVITRVKRKQYLLILLLQNLRWIIARTNCEYMQRDELKILLPAQLQNQIEFLREKCVRYNTQFWNWRFVNRDGFRSSVSLLLQVAGNDLRETLLTHRVDAESNLRFLDAGIGVSEN